MTINVGQYFYTATAAGTDWTMPGRITEYPAVTRTGDLRTDFARVEWPELLGLGQPVRIEQLHLVTGAIAEDAAEVFAEVAA